MNLRVRRFMSPFLLALCCWSVLACYHHPGKYTLRITFRGLIAFVPLGDPEHRKVWVLLPVADDPAEQEVPDYAHAPDRRLPLHQAFVKVPLKYLSPPASDSLADAWIFLALRSANALLPKSTESDYVGHDIDFDQKFDGDYVKPFNLQHVPDLNNPDYPDKGFKYVCDGCIGRADKVPRNLIAARLLLTSGSLEEGHDLLGSDGYFGYYDNKQFHQTQKPKTFDNFAQSATAHLTFFRLPLRLRLTNYTTGERKVFELNPPADQREIKIEIVNLPGDEVLNRREVARTTNDRTSDHFAMFYLISQGHKEKPYLMPWATGSKGGQPYCGHAQLIVP